jgi:hypothetical protein
MGDRGVTPSKRKHNPIELLAGRGQTIEVAKHLVRLEPNRDVWEVVLLRVALLAQSIRA